MQKKYNQIFTSGPAFVLLILMLTGFNFSGYARQAAGYIVTNEQDTVTGWVKVSNISLMNKGVVVNGIDLETFHYMVTFKKANNKRFKTYKVEEILGFEFSVKGQSYCFKRYTLPSNTFVKKEKKRERFLCLMFKGDVALYRDIIRREAMINSHQTAINYNASVYYDYYLFDESHGLTKVLPSSKKEDLIAFLENYGFEADFLDQLPSNVNFKDIHQVLLEYEKWKTSKVKVFQS